ncbi:TrkH family potassium uptake protein [Mangrovibacterium sp.]|uniref:TrkH family potassium uptake protein n=1 Tax=Mangrovibacterium sp. TaxID=1961364 RepID=UPI003568C015
MIKRKINILIVTHIISIIIMFEGLFMIPALLVSLYYKESISADLIRAILLTLCIGAVLNITTRKYRQAEPGVRESLVIASAGWVILALIGSFPYLVSGTIPHFVDAFFESMSGFTTTGSSILADIEVMPKSILFWRSLTHWIGGMGIIVLVIAIMPFLKITGMQLFSSEASVVVEEKVSTKVRYVARNIWMIYVGLTVLEILFLLFGGMPLFDSICHSFATIATGGFSTKNTSITDYSPYIQYVITVFMTLAGINFTLHVLGLRGRIKQALRNQELHLYLEVIVAVGLLLTMILYTSQQITFEKAFRDSFFQVVSIITATGFATADYLLWPIQGIILIALLMLIGACAGSTGGGVKVIRHVINFQYLRNSIRRIIHPNAIFNVRYNNKILKNSQVSSVMNFIIIYYGVVIAGTFIMMLLGNSWATSFGSVLTSMGGIGPGFGLVGPASNFSMLTDGSKYLLSFFMLLGRLEIFPVLSLFTNWFWRT